VLAQRRVHVAEDDALELEVLAVAVVDDLGLVLGGDAREVLALRLRDAELLVGLLDRVGQLVPGVDLLLGRLDVVVDVVEVDARHVAAPVRHRALLEVLERLEAVVPHPVGLALHPGHLLHDVLGEALLGLEDVVLLVSPSQLVSGQVKADVGGRHDIRLFPLRA
jgi:hypothetical protein